MGPTRSPRIGLSCKIVWQKPRARCVNGLLLPLTRCQATWKRPCLVAKLQPRWSLGSSAEVADYALDAFHHARNFLCIDFIRRVAWAVIVRIAEQCRVR